MHWLKREIWKTGIIIAGMLLLLVLMVWIPVSPVDAHEGASGLDTSVMGTVQATPTEDATVTALNKEKLLNDVDQQQHTLGNWLWNNAAALVSSLILAIAGTFTLFRYLRDQRNERKKQRTDHETEREKRAEERFQNVVSGLGSKDIEAKVGAAIMLHTFLKPGYKQFHQQSFDLAVAHLRLRLVYANEPIDSLSQALIRVFTESSPLVRKKLGRIEPWEYNKYLDAAHIRLDGAYLARVDLKNVWMRDAFFIGANLHETKLHASDLRGANFRQADLDGAELPKASLGGANLGGASLKGANLIWVDLTDADLTDANLQQADLKWASLEGSILKGTDLRGVKGKTREWLEACRAKGAIIDEDTTVSSSPSPAAPSPPLQSNDVQVSLAPRAQVNTPIPDTGGDSTASSQLGTPS